MNETLQHKTHRQHSITWDPQHAILYITHKSEMKRSTKNYVEELL